MAQMAQWIIRPWRRAFSVVVLGSLLSQSHHNYDVIAR